MENSELQNKYDQLVSKVKLMMETQQQYFRSGKNPNILRKSKAIEAEVREMVNPVQVKKELQQNLFNDWLGQ